MELGIHYIKMAFGLAGLADCGGSEEYTVSQALKTGQDTIQKAIEIFKEVRWQSLMYLN